MNSISSVQTSKNENFEKFDSDASDTSVASKNPVITDISRISVIFSL